MTNGDALVSNLKHDFWGKREVFMSLISSMLKKLSQTSRGPGRRAGLIMHIETIECGDTDNLKRYECTSTESAD